MPTLQNVVFVENERNVIKSQSNPKLFEHNMSEDNRESLKLDFKRQNTSQNISLGHVIGIESTTISPPSPPQMNNKINNNIKSTIKPEEILSSLKTNKPHTSDSKINFLKELEECLKKFKHNENKNT